MLITNVYYSVDNRYLVEKSNIMSIKKRGDFIQIKNTLIRTDKIVSIKPSTMVQFDETGKELDRGFSNIFVSTLEEKHTFMFEDDVERDEALNKIQSILCE